MQLNFVGLKVFILFFVLGASFESKADRIRTFETSIYTSQASLWSQPGLTYKDCIGLDNSSAFFDRINSGGQLSQEEHRKLELCQVYNPKNPHIPLNESMRVIVYGGEKLLVPLNEKGEPTRYRDANNGEYVKVEYPIKDKQGRISYRKGWVEAGRISTIVDTAEEESTPSQTAEPDSPISNPPPKPSECGLQSNELARCRTEANNIQNHIAQDPAVTSNELGPVKNGNQLRNYLCIYRDHNISIDEFRKNLPQLEKSAAAAEASFKIPKEMIMCAMLDEGGLYHHPNDNDDYQGLVQAGKPIVQQLLDEEINTGSFRDRWKTYQAETKRTTGVQAEWTERNIRESSNYVHATGFMATMMRWIYEERMKDCKECSKDGKFNRRDMYMMIAGYNWSPYNLSKAYNRTLWGIKNTYPPPRETRNYILAMERCMDPKQYERFRPPRNPKTVEPAKSLEYRNNQATCDKLYPKD